MEIQFFFFSVMTMLKNQFLQIQAVDEQKIYGINSTKDKACKPKTKYMFFYSHKQPVQFEGTYKIADVQFLYHVTSVGHGNQVLVFT